MKIRGRRRPSTIAPKELRGMKQVDAPQPESAAEMHPEPAEIHLEPAAEIQPESAADIHPEPAVRHPEPEDEDAILAGLVAAIPVQVFQQVDPIFISDDDDDEIIPLFISDDEDEAVAHTPHPRLSCPVSRYYWLRADERVRMLYYRCTTHGGFLCPDCNEHVFGWVNFVTTHDKCSAFHVSKGIVCARSL